MQIRLRNVLAIGALTSGLVAGGALVADAATTSTTTGNSGSSSTTNPSTSTPSSSSSSGNTGSTSTGSGIVEPVVRLELQLDRLRLHLHPQLPEHGQRLGPRRDPAPAGTRRPGSTQVDLDS